MKIMTKTIERDRLTPHLKLARATPFAILPGDPGRIDRIKKFLRKPEEVAYNREFRTCIGKYRGVDVTVTSTGIGCPSAAIAVEELANIGVRTFVRIGTCGGLVSGMEAGDIVIPVAAMRGEGTTREYVPVEFPAVADLAVTNSLIAAARLAGVRLFTGVDRTHDAFYEPIGNFTKLADIGSPPLVSSEMECSAVFLTAMLRGARAGAILVVNTPEPPKEVRENPESIYRLADVKAVERGMDAAIRIALEAIRKLRGEKYE
ncbi:MAG: nucleoside phosphorylase [Candidatus Micrarchaeota archaeon]